MFCKTIVTLAFSPCDCVSMVKEIALFSKLFKMVREIFVSSKLAQVNLAA